MTHVSHGVMASTGGSGSPKPTQDNTVATGLHPRSVTQTGTPRTSRRLQPRVSPHPSLIRKMMYSGFQKEAIPSTLHKTAADGLIQNGHGSLHPRTSFRSMHAISVPEKPGNSAAGTVPSGQEQHDAPKSSQKFPKHPLGAPPALTPIIHTNELAHRMANSRQSLGIRRVSLGYESSPRGSRRPLFRQESSQESPISLNFMAPTESLRASETPTDILGTSVTPAESLGASLTAADSLGVSLTPADSLGVSLTPAESLGASLTLADSPGASLTPADHLGVSLTPADRLGASLTPADSLGASLTPAVLQGPEDTAMSGGQAWNSTTPSVAVGPRGSTVAPGNAWEPARGTVLWDVVGSKAAVDPRQPRELVASVQAVEKIIIHAVVIIQACARGFLVRRTIKVWHQWAIIIQAAWRGYGVRRDLARLCRAATIIQAAWRGFVIRQSRTQHMLLQNVWAETGSGARTTSDHRCFQSCQPHVCALCQSLTSGLGSPPSVVMLVGSSPRTCHTCGHTLPTRVVHGTGRGAASQAGVPRGCLTQSTSRSLRRPHQTKAATAIQSAWRGFVVRRRLKQQQEAAKMLQATWRGHSTRASLTTDALLGPAAWDNSRHTQWPGV